VAISRRSALILLGIASVALAVFLAAVDPAMKAEGNPTIVDFELAGDRDGADQIVADWGEQGKDAARLSLWVDFAYLLTYGAFLALATATMRELARRRGWRRLAAGGGVVLVAALGAPLFDAIEDIWLLLALAGHGGDLAPRLAAICASLKFALLTVTLAYLLAGLVTMARRRTR
jgi:hypothetical protein